MGNSPCRRHHVIGQLSVAPWLATICHLINRECECLWHPIAPSIHHWIWVICRRRRVPPEAADFCAFCRTTSAFLPKVMDRGWSWPDADRAGANDGETIGLLFLQQHMRYLKKMECSGWLLNIPGDSWCLSSSWEMDVVWMEHPPHTHRILWPEVEFPLYLIASTFRQMSILHKPQASSGWFPPWLMAAILPVMSCYFSRIRVANSPLLKQDHHPKMEMIKDRLMTSIFRAVCIFVAQEWGTTTWYNEKSPVESSGDHWIVNHWQIPFAWAPKVVRISASTQPGGKKQISISNKNIYREREKKRAQIWVNCVSIFRDYYYPFISYLYPHCIPWIPIWMVDGKVTLIAS